MIKLNLKYRAADNGFCRVFYDGTIEGRKGKRLYCWQLVTRGEFALYTCSQDGEADCPVRDDINVTTELPRGDESIERDLTAFLKESDNV